MHYDFTISTQQLKALKALEHDATCQELGVWRIDTIMIIRMPDGQFLAYSHHPVDLMGSDNTYPKLIRHLETFYATN